MRRTYSHLVRSFADMELTRKFNKRFRFLLCVIDIYSKCRWFVPLKDRKSITITYAFEKILDEPNRKTSKLWVDKGIEFSNRSVKSWLKDSDIEMYSTHSKEKSAIRGIFIGALKNKIYKYMTSVSKMCISIN